MDYSKLSTVTDSLSKGKQHHVPATAVGLKVQEHRNPLDSIRTVTKVADAKSGVVVLDTKGIRDLMRMPREDRRKFLARCSDSNRRRILDAMNAVKRISDAGADKLGYMLLDDLLSNVLFDPSGYNKETLDTYVATQEYTEFDEDTKKLIDKVSKDAFDGTADKDLLDKFESHLQGASKLRSISGNITSQNTQEPSEDTWEDDLKEEFTDSVAADCKAFLHAKDAKVLGTLVSDTISMYKNKRSLQFMTDSYWEAFDKAFKEQFEGLDTFQNREASFKGRFGCTIQECLDSSEISDSIHNMLLRLADDESTLDQIAESDYIDSTGKVVHETEDKPIITLLSEALEDFADGDDAKLQALVSSTLNQESSEDTPEEPEEEEDVAFENEPGEEDEEQVEDACRHFAARVLQGKKVNKLYDALRTRVAALRKYNFKVQDCELPVPYQPEATDPAILPPLTHDEFCEACPPELPEGLATLIQGMYGGCTPTEVASVEVQEPYLLINGNQVYVPTTGVASEVANRLTAAEEAHKAHILGSCAVPLSDAMLVFALTNNLHLCDNRFYRTALQSQNWTFDQVPDCLKAQGITKPCILQPCKSIPDGAVGVKIYGAQFKVV